MVHNCWSVGCGVQRVLSLTYSWSRWNGGSHRDRTSHPGGDCAYVHHGPNAGALSNAQRVDRSPQPTSVEVTGPFAVPARTRVVCVSSVPPLLVVVGYWRFGAIPRAVPVVWNQYTFYSIGYTKTLVVATKSLAVKIPE